MAENEINKVHVLIRRFLYEIDDVIKDKDASHKWLVSFAKTLQFQDLCKEPNEYALFLLREAKEFNSIKKRASQIKQVRKILAEEGIKEPTEEQIEQRWTEMYYCENADARQSQRTAGDSQREETSAQKAGGSHKTSVPAVRPTEPEVLNLAYSGEFENVMLTQDQYVALLQKFGNKVACDRAIDSLSAKMENGEEKSRNHYATLVKWANYRADKADVTDNGALPHYETVSEHNRRVLENGRKWIDEHFPKNEAANG